MPIEYLLESGIIHPLYRRALGLVSLQFWATVGAVIAANAVSFLWIYAMWAIVKNERTNGPLSDQPFHILFLAALAPLIAAAAIYFCVTI